MTGPFYCHGLRESERKKQLKKTRKIFKEKQITVSLFMQYQQKIFRQERTRKAEKLRKKLLSSQNERKIGQVESKEERKGRKQIKQDRWKVKKRGQVESKDERTGIKHRREDRQKAQKRGQV